MAKDDYLPPTTGGTLRLKGAKDASVSKKKKKKKPKPTISPSPSQRAGSAERGSRAENDHHEVSKSSGDSLEDKTTEDTATSKERGVNPLQELGDERGEEEPTHVYKTEAERRHEEMRRKRLDERLKREGVKTHKERVEELNRYLSNLSEHHDMPRIGPG